MNLSIQLVLILAALAKTKGNCPGFAVEYGKVSCTAGNEQGSVCTLTCEDGYNVAPKSDDPAQADATCVGRFWDKPLPYCQELCPPNAKADIVFLMDSSGSLRRVTRKLMKDFVKQMISDWTISSDNVNVAIVPYNRDVVIGSTVMLNTFSDNKQGLLEALDNLPFNGRGSLTGKALRYVTNSVLTEANGNRPDAPDIVITMSDGRGQDNVVPPIQELLSMGVATYAVGFHPKRMMLLPGQLMALAGNDVNRLHLTNKRDLGDFSVMIDDMEEIYCRITKPRCWPFPETPDNSAMFCSNGDKFGSVCEISCADGYELIGDSTVECGVHDYVVNWTAPIASCREVYPEPECQNIGVLAHGTIDCDKGSEPGSECEFQCTDPGYQLFPSGVTQTMCTSNGTWDEEKPCCARQCPPYARMDAVLVLDSSSSVGEENWKILKQFVIQLISSFVIGEESARFAAFRYNSFIDTDTEVKLDDHIENNEEMLAAINAIPYNGEGTFTGQALIHAKKVSLGIGEPQLAPGNRPNVQDVVIVITDGWSADSVKDVSQELRDNGVKTYGIAIQRRGNRNFNTTQILEIAGAPDRMFIAEDGFTGLSQDFMNTLITGICTKPCE